MTRNQALLYLNAKSTKLRLGITKSDIDHINLYIEHKGHTPNPYYIKVAIEIMGESFIDWFCTSLSTNFDIHPELDKSQKYQMGIGKYGYRIIKWA